MDIATFFGVFCGFALVIVAITSGGGMAAFINIPSFMIVAGGTLGATLINYPLKDVLKVVAILKNAVFQKKNTPQAWIPVFVDFANKARKEGVLSLEGTVSKMKDPFLKKGIQMAVDGLEPQSIREILETEIEFIRARHRLGVDIFASMGAFAPAMGLIGTLIGLVQMLRSMEDPSSIGPAMAVALITTFYGAIMANLLFLPISGKLKTRSEEELFVKELMLEGVMAVTKGDNPRIVEQKLHAFLAPRLRKSAYER
ncbi:MAG: MotA/TolQ/ExbB proton channel family protein [Deltaproteobacteria bacterium]|nr:MotA/TolQ/ExbB proton channel family protein [Deltaproteobacteria bacterium]